MRSNHFPIAIFSVIFGVSMALFFVYFFLLAASTNWQFAQDLTVAGDLAGALGVFSVLFSGLAAFGLLYTINLQRQALRTQQDEVNKNAGLQMRMLHLELLRFSIESDELAEVWSDSDNVMTEKQSMYVNLVLSHWETSFKHGLMSENTLRLLAKERMQGHFIQFWERHRGSREENAALAGGQSLRFHQIVEDSFQDRRGTTWTPTS